MELYPSSVEKNLSGCWSSYSPKPMLPLKPCFGVYWTVGRVIGAEVQGVKPNRRSVGMKRSVGKRNGRTCGKVSLGGCSCKASAFACRAVESDNSGFCAEREAAESKVRRKNMHIYLYIISRLSAIWARFMPSFSRNNLSL